MLHSLAHGIPPAHLPPQLLPQALGAFQKALQLDPQRPEAMVQYGSTLNMKAFSLMDVTQANALFKVHAPAPAPLHPHLLLLKHLPPPPPLRKAKLCSNRQPASTPQTTGAHAAAAAAAQLKRPGCCRYKQLVEAMKNAPELHKKVRASRPQPQFGSQKRYQPQFGSQNVLTRGSRSWARWRRPTRWCVGVWLLPFTRVFVTEKPLGAARARRYRSLRSLSRSVCTTCF